MKKIFLLGLLSLGVFAETVNINTFLTIPKDALTHQILSINDINLTNEEIIIKESEINFLFTESCSFDFETNDIFCGFRKLDISSKKDFEDID